MKPKKVCDQSVACPKCKAEVVAAFSYSDTVDFRNVELDVEGLERSRCERCEFEWESSGQAARNQTRIKDEYGRERDRIRARDGLLTGAQIHEIRERLGINQREAAVLFGGGPNSFNKYESGEVLQSFAMDRLIRIAGLLGQRAVAFLRDVHAPQSHSSAGTTVIVGPVRAPHVLSAGSTAYRTILTVAPHELVALKPSRRSISQEADLVIYRGKDYPTVAPVLQNVPAQRYESVFDVEGIQV